MTNNIKTIGVVHGGISHEREKSMHYGKQVSKILTELGMNVLEMHLHPNGSWTVNGQIENIEEAIKRTDKVWNCLVGVDGEGGIAEQLCERCKIPLVSHSVLHTNLAADKKNFQFALHQHKIKTPFVKVIYKKDFNKEKLREVFSTVPFPAIVKPLFGSGMMGIAVANNFMEFEKAVEFLIYQNQDVLVEKLINGVPVSCFVFEHNNLLHTHIKVSDEEENLSRDALMTIRNEALYIHNALAFNHHGEYDFILSPKSLVFLEMNSHPSLTDSYIKDVFKSGVVNLKEYVAGKVA